MKNVIVIPFASREGNFSLYLRALSWRYNLKNGNQLDDVPDVIVYRRADEQDDDYDQYDAAQFKFNPEHLQANTNIYVLADGMGSEHFVANVNNFFKREDKFFLPVELIAERLKKLGLTPERAHQLASIKLYVCGDDQERTKLLAINFAKALGTAYADLKVQYYTATITTPLNNNESGKATKFWIEPLAKENSKNLKASAKERKKTITVGEACAASVPFSQFSDSHLVNIALSLNKALEHVKPPTLKITELSNEVREEDTVTTHQQPIVCEPEEDLEDSETATGKMEILDEDKLAYYNVEDIDYDETADNPNRALVVKKELPIIKFYNPANLIQASLFEQQTAEKSEAAELHYDSGPTKKF